MKGSRGLTVRANAVWAFAGNATYAACQWGMLVAIAQIGNLEMVGQFALAFSICAPLFLFTNLQLITVQVTDSRQQNTLGQFMGLRLATTTVAMGVVMAIVVIGGFSATTAAVVLLSAAIKAVDSVSEVIFGDLQRQSRLDLVSVGLITNGVVSLLALVGSLILTRNLVIACAASFFGSVLALFAVNIPNILRASGISHARQTIQLLAPQWDRLALARLAKFAFPLGFSAMLLSLNASVPRYFIEHALGTAALGVFAAFAYFMVAGNTVAMALAQAAMPRLSSLYASGEPGRYDALLSKLLAMGVLLGASGLLAAVVMGRPLLDFVYGPLYGQQASVFVWLMGAAGLNYVSVFMGFAVNATRAYHRLTLPYLGLAIFTIVMSAVLIPHYGLLGAAWSVCATAVASLMMSSLLLVSIRRDPTSAGTA